MNKKGTALILALFGILFTFMLGSTLIMSTRSRRAERAFYQEYNQDYYSAYAGISTAFHLLSKLPYENRFYAPEKSITFTSDLNGDSEITLYDDDISSTTVIIESRVKLKNSFLTLQSRAVFTSWWVNKRRYWKWELVDSLMKTGT